MEHLPGFTVDAIAFEGEGDFCRAYTVNDGWIFRFAYNSEGADALIREAALLPQLSGAVRLPIPSIRYAGAYAGEVPESGLFFVGYPKIVGAPLTREILSALEPSTAERCARDLAAFLGDLHSYSPESAGAQGVPTCEYPLCRTEEGIMQGSAADLYGRELDRLLRYPEMDGQTRRYCEQLVGQLASGQADRDMPPALVHGDLSHEHVLFNPDEGRIVGVIDFTDTIISSRLLDFMYLYHAYGPKFLDALLRYYPAGDPGRIRAGVHLLYGWYTAVRLLWALDHAYTPGVEPRLRELQTLAGAR